MKRRASRSHRTGPSVAVEFRPGRVLICVAVLAASVSIAAAATWVTVGPEGAEVQALVFDPTDCSIVYAGTSAGLYRSADHGETWSLLSLGDTSVRLVAVHPAAPQQIWVVTEYYPGPLRRSVDGGRTFLPVGSVDDGTAPWGLSLALDPDHPETAYLADSGRGRVLATHDGGGGWSPVLEHEQGYWEQVVAARGNVWAMSSRDVVRSTDRGATWQVCDYGLANPGELRELTRDTPYGRLWLATEAGLYVSDDNAVRWFRADFNLPVPRDSWFWSRQVAVAPSAPDTILVVSYDGVFKTTDAVNHWTNLGNGPDKHSWLVAPLFDPCDADRVLWAGQSGPYLSRDGGATWASSARGMLDTTITALYAAPDGTLWVAALMQGIFKSADGGRTWAYAGGDLPYAAWQEEGPSFVVQSFAATTVGQFACTTWGLYVTRDGGATWSRVAGTEYYSVRAMLEDPGRPGTLVAAASHIAMYGFGGLLASGDGGRSWGRMLKTSSYTWVDATAVAADPRDGALIASVWVADDHAGTSWNGLARSTDHGATWSKTGELPEDKLGALLADPFVPGRLHATADGRVYHSDDGGASWHLSLDPPFRRPGPRWSWPDALFADVAGRTLYAGVHSDLYASRDGGLAWVRVEPNLPWPGTQALAVNADGTLVAGTEENGAYLLDPSLRVVRRRLPRGATPPWPQAVVP